MWYCSCYAWLAKTTTPNIGSDDFYCCCRCYFITCCSSGDDDKSSHVVWRRWWLCDLTRHTNISSSAQDYYSPNLLKVFGVSITSSSYYRILSNKFSSYFLLASCQIYFFFASTRFREFNLSLYTPVGLFF